MFRILVIILFPVFALVPQQTWAQDPSCQTFRWDVNGDDNVDIGDVVSLARKVNANEQFEYQPILPATRQLKVLDIGNSFSEDATHDLDGIVRATGADLSQLCVYMLYMGGASFHDWVLAYNNQNTTYYTLRKITGGLTPAISAGFSNDPELMVDVLTEVKWDVIIIHQRSGIQHYYNGWHNVNDVNGDLDAFLEILHRHQPQARIDFMLCHAPSSYIGQSNGCSDTDQLWRKNMLSAADIRRNDGISKILPYGTTIQNLRHLAPEGDTELSRDGLHLSFGLARYAAACTYYQTEIAPFLGIDILGNTYRPELAGWELDLENSKVSVPIPVTDQNAPLAQMAAYMATSFWWQITLPSLYQPLFEDKP